MHIAAVFAGIIAAVVEWRSLSNVPSSPETSPSTAPTSSGGRNTTSKSVTGSELDNATLFVRPGILDLGGMKVSNLLHCFETAPNPSRIVSESDKGYGREIVHLEKDNGEWIELDFRLLGALPAPFGSAALLESVQVGDGTVLDNWEELLLMVEQACSGTAPSPSPR